MIAVLQRVRSARVLAEGELSGQIGRGLLILLGVAEGDTEEDAARLAAKIARLRIFCDDADKMNLSVLQVGGRALVVSNFTLLADYHHGNRPNYLLAAKPNEAERLYERFMQLLAEEGVGVEQGRFGAHMDISIEADGPITIVMDSAVLKNKKEKMA